MCNGHTQQLQHVAFSSMRTKCMSERNKELFMALDGISSFSRLQFFSISICALCSSTTFCPFFVSSPSLSSPSFSVFVLCCDLFSGNLPLYPFFYSAYGNCALPDFTCFPFSTDYYILALACTAWLCELQNEKWMVNTCEGQKHCKEGDLKCL